MKRCFILALLISIISISDNPVAAQTDSAAMMQAWLDYSTPGKMHQLMSSWDGEWKGEMTMWSDPTAAPFHSTCTVKNKMIMGGRYQSSTYTADMMGTPFEGNSIMGYDNAKKKFISTWVDNMGTGIVILYGSWDEMSKTMMLVGQQANPVTGEDMNVRETFKAIDKKTQIMEMFGPDPVTGKEFKMMQIKLTRK